MERLLTHGSIPRLACNRCILGNDSYVYFPLGPSNLPAMVVEPDARLETEPKTWCSAFVWLTGAECLVLCALVNYIVFQPYCLVLHDVSANKSTKKDKVTTVPKDPNFPNDPIICTNVSVKPDKTYIVSVRDCLNGKSSFFFDLVNIRPAPNGLVCLVCMQSKDTVALFSLYIFWKVKFWKKGVYQIVRS